MMSLVLILAAFYAGIQNTLAGGGSCITFPLLLFYGLDPRVANMTSAVAMFPGQMMSAYQGRHLVSSPPSFTFYQIIWICLAGGTLGAILLLLTPSSFFMRILPWLLLFATSVFAWGSFFRKPTQPKTDAQKNASTKASSTLKLHIVQMAIAVYGGYFGGGIGLLLLATLSTMGLQNIRYAGATKNMMAMIINAPAILIFIFSDLVNWKAALLVSIGAVSGGYCGTFLLKRLPQKLLQGFVVLVGLVITLWLFLR